MFMQLSTISTIDLLLLMVTALNYDQDWVAFQVLCLAGLNLEYPRLTLIIFMQFV